MHIVHVTHRTWPVAGGSEHYVMELARRQVDEGHRVTVVATQADELAALWRRECRMVAADTVRNMDGVDIVRLAIRHMPFGAVTFPALRRLTILAAQVDATWGMHLGRFVPWLPDLRNTLVELGADLLFAWNLTLEGLTIAVAREAERSGSPWIAVPLLHLARPRFYTMQHQIALLAQASHTLAQTPHERVYLLGRGMDPQKVSVVSPGVDPTDASGADGTRFRHRFGIGNGPLIVTLGTLGYDKGTLHLLEAARRLWDAGFPLELALVGTPLPELRRAVRKLPARCRSYCHELGRISERDKWDALAAADVMALPSRTESFGTVFLEAWLLGKPVIGARSGAVSDVVEDGVDGLLVEFGDVSELARGMQALTERPAYAANMGKRGQQKVLSAYTWAAQYRRVAVIVNGLAS